METKDLFIPIVGFQKKNFEKTYKYVMKTQDQVEQRVSTFIEGTALVPEPAKQLYKQWAETARISRDSLKKYADDGYQNIEGYLATTA